MEDVEVHPMKILIVPLVPLVMSILNLTPLFCNHTPGSMTFAIGTLKNGSARMPFLCRLKAQPSAQPKIKSTPRYGQTPTEESK